MKTDQILYLAGAGALVGGVAFIGIRAALREKVRQAIVGSAAYAQARLVADTSGLFGFDIGLPTADELSRSLVPLLSTASPYEAAEDIERQGRQSRFWPVAYRTSDLPPALEMAIITVALAVARGFETEKTPGLIDAA
jgi:hypothetical protein